ncbi:putative ribonuclease H-like domain-containing protein [Tanacetum coccineum]
MVSKQESGIGQDFKPVRTEKEALMTIDEGQINWVEQTEDEELNHALMAFTVNNEVSMCSKLCLDSFNALQAKYDELLSEFGDQEAALVAHKLAVKKLESQLKASHKQQSSLTEKLNFQANQIFEKDEKLKKYRRIGMKAVKDKDALQKIFDSWSTSSKNLWKLVDCGMSSTVKIGLGYGIKSNAEVLGYEEEISRGIFAFRETNAGYNDIPLYSRFKQVEYKGVPHPLSGDYTPREQEDIDDSLYEYGKYGPQPQSPSPTVSNASSIVFSICPSNDSDGELGAVSDASSTHYSTCQSNDSDGELGTVSDHSVNDDPIPIPSIEQVTIATQKTQPQVPKPTQTVDPSCTVSRTIKTGRVNVNTGKQNVSSGSLHVSSGTHIKSGASSFNTGKQHVNSGRIVTRPVLSNQTSQVNLKSPKKCFSKQRSPVNRPFTKNTAYKSNNYAVKGKMGTAVKTSAGCVWRKTTPHSNTNSGPTPASYVHVFQGPQGRPKPVKAWAHHENIKNFPSGDLLLLDEVSYAEELLQFKLQQIHPQESYKVVKALYGAHQAPRAWYATLSNFLEKHGYRRGTIDKTLFIKKDKKDIILVQIYVMNIILDLQRNSGVMNLKPLMKEVNPKVSSPNEKSTPGDPFLGRRLISWHGKKQQSGYFNN